MSDEPERDDPTATALGTGAAGTSAPDDTAAMQRVPQHVPPRPRFSAGEAIGHYEIIRGLGQGGMGEVYLARDTRLGRRVALKVLQRVSPTDSARFALEARATAWLSHENIVALYDVAEHHGLPYMVLEYVPGRTLAAWLRERRQSSQAAAGVVDAPSGVPAARAAELMLPVARALACAHEARIVHRDLKPSNIMLAENGSVKVLDFGVAKLLAAQAPHAVADDAPGVASEAPAVDRGARAEATAPPAPSADAAADATAVVKRPTGSSDRAGAAASPAADSWSASGGPGALGSQPASSSAIDTGIELGIDSGFTRASAQIGTQPYMAPEQWRGEAVDGRADLWAVGIILHQLVAGAHPLGPLSPEALASVGKLELPMPRTRDRVANAGAMGDLIDRCLSKPLGERLGSARELIAELEAIARPTRGSEDDDQESPYAGLTAFQERDSARFFGRETQIEQVVARLAEQPLLACIGSSGAGKSSLMRAGVIPALKRGGDAWEAFALRPGPRPLHALAELLRQAQQPQDAAQPTSLSGSDEAHRELLELLEREPGLLGRQLRERARRRRERVLLFVDQFEEVYTLAAALERDAFLASLTGTVDDASSPLRVVLALRHDFLDRVAASSATLAELISRGTALVGPLDRDGLSRALKTPAERRGYRFESEALLDEMLQALRGAASALPILQFTAAKLWEGRDRERRLLTEACYRGFGGVSGALASHAEQVLAGFSSDERRCARAVLLRLVTPERTRAIVTRAELAQLGDIAGTPLAPLLDRVLDRLTEARLLTAEGAEHGDGTVELLHESLIQAWPTLVRWLGEQQGDAPFRTRLRVTAQQWEAGDFAEGLLWRGAAGEEARRWRQGHGRDAALSAREQRYVDAVIALADREQRSRRRLIATVITGLLAVVVVVAALAVRSEQAAERAVAERAVAERAAASARNATRLAVARERQKDPTVVLALLRELEPGAIPQGWAELARWAPQAGVAQTVIVQDVEVRSAAVSPDGATIATASEDSLVRVWRADGAGAPKILRGHDEAITAVTFSPDGRALASASEDKTVRVWKLDGGDPVVLRGHGEPVTSLSFSPDGRRLASGSRDKTVRIWNLDGGGAPVVLRGHDNFVSSVAFGPDGRNLASASWDTTVRVWSSDGIGEPVVLRGHQGFVMAVAFSPDGRRVASASIDASARVWNSDGSGQPTVLTHTSGVTHVAFSHRGDRVVTSSEDAAIRVWRSDGEGAALLLRGSDRIKSAVFSPDDRSVISASLDKTVRVWNLEATKEPIVFSDHERFVLSVELSRDGQRLLTSSLDKTVRIRRVDGNAPPVVLHGHEGIVSWATFDPDNTRVASASWDKTVRVWNADGSGAPLVLRGHDNFVYCVAFSPDGARIASASADKTARVWRADGSGEPVVLRGHEASVVAVQFSPDGRRVATASMDKTVRVWTVDGSGEPVVLRGHEGGVASVAWSADGRHLATAAWDKTVRVWDLANPRSPRVLRGHENRLTSVAWSPSGEQLASTGTDGTVRIWQLRGDAEAPLVLRRSTSELNRVAWAPDGRGVVAASDDRTAIYWRDLTPLQGVDDARLWETTSFCMPMQLRAQLLGFSPQRSRLDLERCERHVRAATSATATR